MVARPRYNVSQASGDFQPWPLDRASSMFRKRGEKATSIYRKRTWSIALALSDRPSAVGAKSNLVLREQSKLKMRHLATGWARDYVVCGAERRRFQEPVLRRCLVGGNALGRCIGVCVFRTMHRSCETNSMLRNTQAKADAVPEACSMVLSRPCFATLQQV